MSNKIIECVPNFSEGRNMDVIRRITDAIERTEGVKLLHVDPGKGTNRTVVTFVGDDNSVVEAAYRAICVATELIDMRHHTGAHPRFGATDVCPFIPIANATMEDCIACAHRLGERVGRELGIPVYLYEYAATAPHRKNLADVRAGEYEGIPRKIILPEWKPDYGPAQFNEKSGNIAIGARNILIAYNVNLNTTSTRRANAVAFDVREQGRKVKNEKGEEVVQPGACKAVKGIGWYIPEYKIAQVSMNLTNIQVTPVHIAFEECVKSATRRGMRVTGSELVGLIPKQALLDAGRYFLEKQQRSTGVSEEELIHIAIKSLGLDDLAPFHPRERVIEYLIEDANAQRLVKMNLREFANETASESPAPGGGSVAAYVGALGIALGTMVANLSSHKRGWDERWKEFSDYAEKGQRIKDRLLSLVDEDTRAFNRIMEAYALPKNTDAEKAARQQAIQQAVRYAIETPLQVMELSLQSFEVIKAMAEIGNPNSVSDAGVGAICARGAVYGAYLNVKINAGGCEDKTFVQQTLSRAEEVLQLAKKLEEEVLHIVNQKIAT
ncbi:MAG: glutamate formimidoyltransferase [Chitinophagales bacterium]|nr:glutamate formimidoyltransferase [Chitinophagales bacterium]MDW8419993.1 glutamate formimidoyltransferase [Chitinophagales bacterium]